MDQDSHMEAFEAFAEYVLDQFHTVESVVLFGSVARGEHGIYSDVDVLITVSNLSERAEIEDAAFSITNEYGVPLTPIIAAADRDKTSFLQTVAEEGIEYVRG